MTLLCKCLDSTFCPTPAYVWTVVVVNNICLSYKVGKRINFGYWTQIVCFFLSRENHQAMLCSSFSHYLWLFCVLLGQSPGRCPIFLLLVIETDKFLKPNTHAHFWATEEKSKPAMGKRRQRYLEQWKLYLRFCCCCWYPWNILFFRKMKTTLQKIVLVYSQK